MRMVFMVLLATIGATGPLLKAQEAVKGDLAPPIAVTSAINRDGDAKAIKSLLLTFTNAYNSGDAAACAATYTEDALIVDEEGLRTEGRAAIRDQLAKSFADTPKTRIAIEVDSLRFLGTETALEEGRATITPASGADSPEITRFTAVYIKQQGRWLQAAVRDELAHDLSPHERLKELEWLIGEWVNESQDAIVFTTCAWAKGGNFLDREFTVKIEKRSVLSGTQRIGWDPLKKQFKMWLFDSEGGHGEGYFTHIGQQWLVKLDGVGGDGEPYTATNIITRLGKDRMGWQSTMKTHGGSAIPGVDEFVVVRKPPEVRK